MVEGSFISYKASDGFSGGFNRPEFDITKSGTTSNSAGVCSSAALNPKPRLRGKGPRPAAAAAAAEL